MSPVVRISEATFAKLQLLAQPLVDTPDQVISRCLDRVLELDGPVTIQPSPAQPAGEVHRLDPDNPGELRYARVRDACIGGADLRPANWNAMLREVHLQALRHFGSFDALSNASASHLRPGRYEDDGFRYIPEGDFSIQGQDSNLSWANSLRLAKVVPLSLSVRVEWLHREGSQHPGETGILEWAPEADSV